MNSDFSMRSFETSVYSENIDISLAFDITICYNVLEYLITHVYYLFIVTSRCSASEVF